MKTTKLIRVVLILTFLPMSTYSQDPSGRLKFMEAYTFEEFTAGLDPDDPFFQLLRTEDRSPGSSKLGFCPEANVKKTWTYLHGSAFGKKIPEEVQFVWGAEQEEDGTFLYALKGTPKGYFGPGKSDIEEISIGEGMLLISFTTEGSRKWADLTQACMGKPLAIIIDDLVYAAPLVREAIHGGKCALSGNYTPGELADLKAMLE